MHKKFPNRPRISHQYNSSLFSLRKYQLFVIIFLVIVSPRFHFDPIITSALYTNEEHHSMYQTPTTGSFLEYLLDTHIVVSWNYTIQDEKVISLPGRVFHEVKDGVVQKNLINIKIQYLDWIDSEQFSLRITYSTQTSLEFSVNHSIHINYSWSTGRCEIVNGSLAGRDGFFYLYSDNWQQDLFQISSLGDLCATATLSETEYPKIVKGENQMCTQYSCVFTHCVDGNVTHHREYDDDTRILIGASGGIADFVMLGLGNISYAVGTLSLIDTNIELGPPVLPPAIGVLDVVGPASLGIFGALYIVLYRAQRKKDPSKKTKKKRNKKVRKYSQIGILKLTNLVE